MYGEVVCSQLAILLYKQCACVARCLPALSCLMPSARTMTFFRSPLSVLFAGQESRPTAPCVSCSDEICEWAILILLGCRRPVH